MKDINKLYRSYLRALLPEDKPPPKKVFLFLRFSCPNGTYDVNIEPAKNQVMFGNLELISHLFKEMCKRVYGERTVSQLSKQAKSSTQHELHEQGFDILLARKPSTSIAVEPPGIETQNSISSRILQSEANTTTISSGKQTQTPPMQSMGNNLSSKERTDEIIPEGMGEEKFDVAQAESQHHDQEAAENEEIMHPSVSNPFVFAKLNSRVRPQDLSNNAMKLPVNDVHQSDGDDETISSPTSRLAAGPSPAFQPLQEGLPSPSVSPDRPFQNPGPPNRPWKTRNRNLVDAEEVESPILSPAPSEQTPRPSLLESWAKSVNSQNSLSAPPAPTNLSDTKKTSMQQVVAVSALPSSTASQDLTHKDNLELKIQQKPFSSPVKKTNKNSAFASGSNAISQAYPSPASAGPSIYPSPKDESYAKPQNFQHLDTPKPGSFNELSDIMEFEDRKRNSILQHKARHAKQGLLEQPLPPSHNCNKDIVSDNINSEDQYALRFSQSAEISEEDFIPPQPKSASYTQNPHQNRYRKALRDLEDRSTMNQSKVVPSSSNHSSIENNETLNVEPITHTHHSNTQRSVFSSDDPRKYLIEMQKPSGKHDKTRNTKSKHSKFPFEKTQPDEATYNLMCVMPNISATRVQSLVRVARVLKETEPYIVEGFIENTLPSLNIDKKTLMLWDSKMQHMLQLRGITSLPPHEEESLRISDTAEFINRTDIEHEHDLLHRSN